MYFVRGKRRIPCRRVVRTRFSLSKTQVSSSRQTNWIAIRQIHVVLSGFSLPTTKSADKFEVVAMTTLYETLISRHMQRAKK